MYIDSGKDNLLPLPRPKVSKIIHLPAGTGWTVPCQGLSVCLQSRAGIQQKGQQCIPLGEGNVLGNISGGFSSLTKQVLSNIPPHQNL